MAATSEGGTGSPDSLASLERLKQVETDGDGRLRMVREKIDQTLSQLRNDGEVQIHAAREQAELEAATMLEGAQLDADAEAARIIADAKATLAQRAEAGPADLTNAWPDILRVLFGEFD